MLCEGSSHSQEDDAEDELKEINKVFPLNAEKYIFPATDRRSRH
jgi:hypothetical protein